MSSPGTCRAPRRDIGDVLDDDYDASTTALHAERPKTPTWLHKMLNLCKEIAIMLLAATVYAAITNDAPVKVGKSPAAYPFFPHDSLIKDWYRGQVGAAIEEVRMSDLSFVMFYAPWDASSQATREEFQTAADVMGHRVSFASVNCWQPGSECKRQYGKVFKWPVLIAYPTHGRGVQYNGPLQAIHMVRFLQNMCKPLIRPSRIEDVIYKYDEVIAAEIDSRPKSLHYAVFYTTALQFLERDPGRDIPFVILPKKKGSQPKLTLYMWNETLIYDGNWETETLFNWLIKNLKFLVDWIAPMGVKSRMLSAGIQSGPALIVFTPKNPLFDQVDHYNLVREVAYDYNNCDNITYYNMKRLKIYEERLKNRLDYYNLEAKCSRLLIGSHINWSNSTTTTHYCLERRHTDPLQQSFNYDQCKIWSLLKEHYFASNIDADRTNVTGLACKTNQSLTFIAMDTFNYYQYAEKLGIDLSKFQGKSAAVIVNDNIESHYILDKDITSASLRNFIRNFTENTLQRSLKSHVNVRSTPRRGHITSNIIFSVSELNSDNFLKEINRKDRSIMLFYYSKQCAFCSGISHVFLTVAKMTASVKELQFSRIDGDTNLLPWEYTMETFPTILLFPRWKKSESRAFPQSLPITVPNLLSFLLANLDPALKFKVMCAICRDSTPKVEKKKCLQRVRTETMNLIGQTLKQWRRASSRQRVHIMRKLQALKRLHLAYESSEIDEHLHRLTDYWMVKDEL